MKKLAILFTVLFAAGCSKLDVDVLAPPANMQWDEAKQECVDVKAEMEELQKFVSGVLGARQVKNGLSIAAIGAAATGYLAPIVGIGGSLVAQATIPTENHEQRLTFLRNDATNMKCFKNKE